ncbi:hypothetical protein C1H46_017716 [Malus baccata]|uniref:Uncharacterized protein n=1 Tax=Malus baccata TaxID=106549 RepID=A0A540MD34_MALBA|nr:hypothetical protein C1H46_017716 [Malus baccata]
MVPPPPPPPPPPPRCDPQQHVMAHARNNTSGLLWKIDVPITASRSDYVGAHSCM